MDKKPVEETLVQKRIREDLEAKKKENKSFSSETGSGVGIDSQKYDSTNLALMDFLELKSEDWESFRDKLSVIREWAEKTARSTEKVEILSVLKYLREKLVQPEWGANQLKSLYRYIRLDLDQRRIEEEKKLYEK